LLYRFQLDLAKPEVFFKSIPDAKKQAFRNAVRAVKSYAVKINEGKVNEEMTVVAQWHCCHHDEGKPCEPEQDI